MPEGHTIRALGNRWQRHVGQRVSVQNPNGRVPAAKLLDGQVLTEVDVHGKHLFLRFGDQWWLHVHLGRFGKFRWHEMAEGETIPEPAPTVRVRLIMPGTWVDLIGAITNTVLDPQAKEAAEAKIGPDPLQPGADPTVARQRIQASKRHIGELLMDQHVIAGIGNIYRAELLWRNEVDPYRPGTSIDDALFAQLWADTKLLLQQGVDEYQEGKPTHTMGLPLPDGSSPVPAQFGRRNHTQVYQRTGLPCARDGHSIQQAEMAGRTLFWCPACQV